MNNVKEFRKEVVLLRDNLNEVVAAFERFQPFKKIETETEAFDLVANPRIYYDQIIVQGSVMIGLSGALALKAITVAEAFKLDREGYREAIKLPASIDKIPKYAVAQLPEEKRFLFSWKGKFVINRELLKSIINL